VAVEESQGFRGGTGHYQGIVKWVQPRADGSLTRLAILEIQEGRMKRDKLFDCSKLVSVERIKEMEEKEGSLVARYRRLGSSKAALAILSYLTRGLAWAPSYSLLLLNGGKTLILEGQATILCDLPFFDGKPISSVSLVAGQPKVELAQLSDPLTSGEGAMDFIRHLENQSGGNGPPPPPGARNMFCMSRSAAPPPPPEIAYGMNMMEDDYDIDQSVEGIKGGENVEDFFYYQLECVPLKHDQPVKIPFIKQCGEIEYEDIYFIELDRKVDVAINGEDEESSVEVKHAITFKNPTGQPLTSAPVSVLAQEKGEEGQSRFMVQAMMKFTGPGKPVTVELTRTFDVQANFVIETGKERKSEQISKAVTWTGQGKKYADVISKKGKMSIKNHKKTAIKCKIEHTLEGHLTNSDPTPKEAIERPSRSHMELNPTSKMTWEISVPAEGVAELNIQYDVKVWQ